MSRYPKLTFGISKSFDYWTCLEFLTYKDSDDFSDAILFFHPDLEKYKNYSKMDKEASIKKHIDDFYKKNYLSLTKHKNLAFKNWLKIEQKFFMTTGKYFVKNGANEPLPWPKGNYKGYVSIFNINPRSIEDKEFQLFYKHEYPTNYICVHEMLHFILYEHLEKKFPQQYQSSTDDYIWKLSEILNDIILRQEDFIELTGVKNPEIYAQTKKELDYYLGIWKDSTNLDRFLKHYFKHNKS